MKPTRKFTIPLLALCFAVAGLGAGVLELYGRRKRRGPNGGARTTERQRPDDMAGAQA